MGLSLSRGESKRGYISIESVEEQNATAVMRDDKQQVITTGVQNDEQRVCKKEDR